VATGSGALSYPWCASLVFLVGSGEGEGQAWATLFLAAIVQQLAAT
jgi:hypothetical protein